MVTQSNGTKEIRGTPEFLRQPSRQRITFLAAFFCQESGGSMHLVKQRLFNTILNPPLPLFSTGGNFFSTFHKGGLRGILPSLITVAIFFILALAITNTASDGQAIL